MEQGRRAMKACDTHKANQDDAGGLADVMVTVGTFQHLPHPAVSVRTSPATRRG
jgi:hypothetical protein